MLSEFEKRVAALVVSRYGADRLDVQETIAAVQAARGRGESADLLEALCGRNLLSAGQCQELRISLDETRIDPLAPVNGSANGSAQAAPHSRISADDATDDAPDDGWEMVAAESHNGNGNGKAADATEELRQLGQFRLLRRLGEGGMGAVYLGYHEEHDRHVAIKVLSPQLALTQALVDRFYREAKSGALLNHPNIVRNLAVGQDQATGRHYLVLEYIDGQSAQALLDQMGRLPVGDALHITLDIARALEHAHSRNIVHRDIKPANIVITQSGMAKLTDLGLARRTDEASHLTVARQGFGTPYYMPYEQAMNARSADARSDLFALGATLYHLVTGAVPFPGTSHLEIVDRKNLGFFEPASQLNPDVPAALDQMLSRLLAREPRDRYQTASELIVDIDRSGLAAAVPSFVDAERALEDPLMRQRWMVPAQPTALDVGRESARTQKAGEKADIGEWWYLRYRDRQGNWCKAKATMPQVLQRLREGKLRGDLEASQQAEGEFLPLSKLPQFRKVLADRARLDETVHTASRAQPAPGNVADARHDAGLTSAWWVLAATLAALVMIVAVFLYLLFWPS